ncbi:hypothetical protein EVAR_46056_1 [Eumeta japonica]|uniref:Uncharacterized protein n=1 Tax=Eumeta variegata TaxID=151549 RepID=A0A4C2A7L4_EUMVA|nr:hypothetical protein EVAR_46056_1 [Eumeta japonica]
MKLFGKTVYPFHKSSVITERIDDKNSERSFSGRPSPTRLTDSTSAKVGFTRDARTSHRSLWGAMPAFVGCFLLVATTPLASAHSAFYGSMPPITR